MNLTDVELFAQQFRLHKLPLRPGVVSTVLRSSGCMEFASGLSVI